MLDQCFRYITYKAPGPALLPAGTSTFDLQPNDNVICLAIIANRHESLQILLEFGRKNAQFPISGAGLHPCAHHLNETAKYAL